SRPMQDRGRGQHLGEGAEEAGQKAPKADTLKDAFQTPTLRSVSEHPPYFHDGRAQKLEDVVDLVLKGGIKNPNLDEKLKPRKIKPEERSQLLAFLKSLTPEQKPFEKPQVP